MDILHLTLINQSIDHGYNYKNYADGLFLYTKDSYHILSKKILLAFTQNKESNNSDQVISQQKSFSP